MTAVSVSEDGMKVLAGTSSVGLTCPRMCAGQLAVVLINLIPKSRD